MNNPLKVILILLFFLSAVTLDVYAQDSTSTRQQEIGFSTNGYSINGLYRIGTADRMWRFGTGFGNVNFGNRERSDSILNRYNGVSAYVGAGVEARKPILDNMEFRYGADLGYSFRYYNETQENGAVGGGTVNSRREITHTPSIYFVVGVNYVLDERFVFGAEFNPGIDYRVSNSVAFDSQGDEVFNTQDSTLSFFWNNALTISAAYRF